MQNASHTIRDELYGIVAFIGVIWGVFSSATLFPAWTTSAWSPARWAAWQGFRLRHFCTRICITS